MELGLFQLENLFLNPNRFLFIDLRPEAERSLAQAMELKKIVSRAEAVEAKAVASVIAKRGLALEFPVVLMCGDGKRSHQLAAELERAGHNNVYVVTGGVAGLLSEL